MCSKWQNWLFATFMARFRIFWKMMFGKMQKFFWYDHSKLCLKRPKVLLHNAPMWNGAKQKIHFFQFFQKQNIILLFEYFTYIKNVIFWGILRWCSSKIELLEGGSKAAIVAYEHPLTLYQILSYINMMYLKRSHFSQRIQIQKKKA